MQGVLLSSQTDGRTQPIETKPLMILRELVPWPQTTSAVGMDQPVRGVLSHRGFGELREDVLRELARAAHHLRQEYGHEPILRVHGSAGTECASVPKRPRIDQVQQRPRALGHTHGETVAAMVGGVVVL